MCAPEFSFLPKASKPSPESTNSENWSFKANKNLESTKEFCSGLCSKWKTQAPRLGGQVLCSEHTSNLSHCPPCRTMAAKNICVSWWYPSLPEQTCSDDTVLVAFAVLIEGGYSTLCAPCPLQTENLQQFWWKVWTWEKNMAWPCLETRKQLWISTGCFGLFACVARRCRWRVPKSQCGSIYVAGDPTQPVVLDCDTGPKEESLSAVHCGLAAQEKRTCVPQKQRLDCVQRISIFASTCSQCFVARARLKWSVSVCLSVCAHLSFHDVSGGRHNVMESWAALRMKPVWPPPLPWSQHHGKV